MRETCEMRRAREYGIEEVPASNTATGYSPLAQWEARRPNALDYPDPIVFGLDFARWQSERPNA